MSINLLPWRDIQQGNKVRRLFFRLFTYTLTLIFMLFILNFILEKQIHQFELEKRNLQNNIQKIIIHTSIKNNAFFLKTLNDGYQKKLQSLKMNSMIMALLSDIAQNIPDSVTLDTLAITQQKIQLVGVSNQLSDVQQYTTTLSKKSIWQHEQLSDIHTDNQDKPEIHFTLWITP